MYVYGQRLTAVVLDVDGVLVDSVCTIERNLEKAAEVCGLPLEPIRPYINCLGSPRWQPSLHGGIQTVWPHLNVEQIDRVASSFRQHEFDCKFVQRGDSVAAVCYMKDLGLKLALCSTNSRQALAYRLRCLGIPERMFSVINHGYSLYRKPNPKALTSVLKRLNVPACKSVYIGDWATDVQVAQGAGVKFVGITTPPQLTVDYFTGLGVPADHVVNCLSEFVDQITTGPR